MVRSGLLGRFLRLLSRWFEKSPLEGERASCPAEHPAGSNTSFTAPAPLDYLAEDGKVGRFIFGSRDLRKDNRPRPSAFEPEKHPLLKRFETSVCGISGVSFERISELGQAIRKDKKALAITMVSVTGVRQVGLICEAAPEPQNNYPEHCVIIGWNEDDDKSARMSAQQALAAQADDAIRFEPAM